jgi:hypothetical protein
MRRALLLGLSMIAGAIPSFADIAFYSSQSAWIAAHTGIVSDDFGNSLVTSYNSFTYPAYISSTGAQVNSSRKEISLFSGNGPASADNTNLWGGGGFGDLGTGRYLTTNNTSGQFVYSAHITGTENQILQDGYWVDDGTSNANVIAYGGGDAQQDEKITIAAPANQTGVAFDLAAITGLYARGATITVTTMGGLTLTLTPTLGYQQFSFFGFDVGDGDTIAGITISTLWAAINDNFGPTWTTNGNSRTRAFNGFYNWGEDYYRLGLDNLTFGTYTSGGGPPVDPPPGDGGDAPEAASLAMTGLGLTALGLLYRKRR